MDRPMLPQVPRVSATPESKAGASSRLSCLCLAIVLTDGWYSGKVFRRITATPNLYCICIALNSTTWTVDQNALVEALADGFDCRGGRPITAASCQWGVRRSGEGK
eukprot:scaffold168329_cov101-Cyclotella_meneghiniana.AAC.3